MRFRLGSRIPDSDRKTARSDSEAEERFVKAMNDALGLLSRSSQWRGARPKHGTQRTLVLMPDEVVPFRCGSTLPVYFQGALTYEFERDERPGHEGGRKVVVRGYIYSLRVGQDEPGEFVAWHWHPTDGPDMPHVHVRADHPDVVGLRDMHLPTARVFLEDIMVYAIRDLAAQCREGALASLEAARLRTNQWASWR